MLKSVRSFYFAAYLHANSFRNRIYYISKCLFTVSVVLFIFPRFEWVYILI
uniref:Uncharacterized protein n=1 Tax=Siphoviridae sp. ctDmQ3 TaxID=2823570 RepID=A0A8S5L858_9CAUD|nr:MAG TPA: hypothetical protein [Siphoviridae sp. ctDmQ3]